MGLAAGHSLHPSTELRSYKKSEGRMLGLGQELVMKVRADFLYPPIFEPGLPCRKKEQSKLTGVKVHSKPCLPRYVKQKLLASHLPISIPPFFLRNRTLV